MARSISELTLADRVAIISTFKVLSDERMDCSKCLAKVPEKYREKMGCLSPRGDVYQYRRAIYWQRCPANFYNGAAEEFITLNRHFENGLLPFDGGMFDWPSKFFEAADLVASLKSEEERKRMEKASKHGRKHR